VRNLVTTLLELAGLTLMVVGVALLSVPAALIVAGCGFVAVGYLEGREG
jgi:hypothetical protein